MPACGSERADVSMPETRREPGNTLPHRAEVQQQTTFVLVGRVSPKLAKASDSRRN
jgi:hypothetical protein